MAWDDFRSGDLAAAVRRVETVLALHPRRADARLAKGVILAAQGDQPRALDWLLSSLELEPNNADALSRATFLSLNLRRFPEAEGLARRLVKQQPKNYHAHYLLSSSLRAQDRIEEALAEIDRALALKPDDLDSLVTKARLLKSWQLSGLAIEVYRRALAIRPHPPAALDLAEILLRESHPEEALALLRDTAAELPESDRPYAVTAQALAELHRFDEADIQWAKAERHARDPALVLLRRAKSEIAVGRFHDAENRLTEAIAKGLRPAACFVVLSTAKKMTAADLALVERMAGDLASGAFHPSDAAQLNYALGKCYDDLSEYGQAIRFFDEANRISFQISPQRKSFTPEGARASTDFLIETFTKRRLDQFAARGIKSKLPLFVVGMMRSGTTLTEHILSSHSRVRAGGEQSFWTERVAEYTDWAARSFDFEEALRLGGKYLAMIDPKRDGIDYVVDKNPGNTMFVAMLHAVYPDAKFVHVKRHPVDNLLSIWMTPVSGNVAYTCDRQNLVIAYREYLRLLGHFNDVLPEECFQSFKYEDITAQPDKTIRAMLCHLRLEPEPACFTPEDNARTVLTPSVYQVRQPIHQGSQERWKRYEPWLGPFAELLETPE